MSADYAHDPHRWTARGPTLLGLIVIAGLFGGLGVWSANAQINGAVVAPGELRVESQSKPVQHHEGGIVGAIFVANGERVREGDPLIRLDQTLQEASLEIVDRQRLELEAERARLLAERDEDEGVVFPQELRNRALEDEALRKALDDQRALFIARLDSYNQQRAQYRERVGQLANEIAAARARRDSFAQQLTSVSEDVAIQRDLLDKGLTTRTRMQQFSREQARIEGEIGALEAEEARARRQIEETKIEVTRLRETRREEALARLREVQVRLAELTQRLVVAEDALRKIELRAPQDGVVQDLTVFAPGAVVGAGEPIMLIVPVDDRLILQARIPTNKRDDVEMGRESRVRFTSFDQNSPELKAQVVKISADRKIDDATNAPYYEVDILVPEEERARLDESDELVPGMPAEIYILTEARTPLNYLLKPLTDGFSRAFRD